MRLLLADNDGVILDEWELETKGDLLSATAMVMLGQYMYRRIEAEEEKEDGSTAESSD